MSDDRTPAAALPIVRRFTALWARLKDRRAARRKTVAVCTFDSGFGGFLTAKAFERLAAGTLLPRYRAGFTIQHFGDTLCGPYGSRETEDIVFPAASHIANAFDAGVQAVMIACNTVSAHCDDVRRQVECLKPGRGRDVLSVVDVTVPILRRRIDARLRRDRPVHVIITATPATVKSGVYVRELHRLYGGTLHGEGLRRHVPGRNGVPSYTKRDVLRTTSGGEVHIYSLAPGSWVELIESGADLRQRRAAAMRDVGYLADLLPEHAGPDVIGEFCTHYPVFFGPFITALDALYRERGTVCAPVRIHQAEAAARRLAEHVTVGLPRRSLKCKPSPADLEALRVRVAISGDDVHTVTNTARLMFPADPLPPVFRQKTPGVGGAFLEEVLPA